MAEHDRIREHMDVIGADGAPIGQVDSVDGGRIKLTRQSSPDGEHHYVPLSEVERVDQHVHLRLTRAALFGAAGGAAGMAAGAAYASGAAGSTHSAAASASTGKAAGEHDASLPPLKNPAVPGAQPRRNYMLPWVLLGLAVLGLLLALSRCGTTDAEKRAEAVQRDVAEQALAANRGGTAAAPTSYRQGTLAYDVNQYLLSNARAERSFEFANLNFDTGSAAIRDEDRSDLVQLAEVLKANPGVRAAVIGYADARGDDQANVRLGAERAVAVITALRRRGVDTRLLEARTGGERNPLGNNADAGGQAANRRTEFLLLEHR